MNLNKANRHLGAYTESRRYPTRERRAPNYRGDFVREDSDSDGMHVTVDYCCRAVCGIPQTYGEAMQSDNSKEWRKAMNEEIQSPPHPHPHRQPLIPGRVAGGAAQAGGPRLPFPGPH